MELSEGENSGENMVLVKEDSSDGGSPSSGSSREEPGEGDSNTRAYAAVDKVRKKLINTAQMDRLMDLLDSQLQQSGWKKDIRDILKVEIQEDQNQKLDNLFQLVREEGQVIVPAEIRNEIIKMMMDCYKTNIFETDSALSTDSDQAND